jgi:hypothetical protein
MITVSAYRANLLVVRGDGGVRVHAQVTPGLEFGAAGGEGIEIGEGVFHEV